MDLILKSSKCSIVAFSACMLLACANMLAAGKSDDSTANTKPKIRYRATANNNQSQRPTVWRGPIRDSNKEAQADATDYKKKHPDLYVRVSQTGDPDFSDD